MKIKIVKAKPEHFRIIKEIYTQGVIDEFKTQFTIKNPKKYFGELGIKEVLRAIKKILKKSSKEIIFIAKNKGEVLGFSHLKVSKNNQGLIDKIYVSRKFRRKGIAKKLMSVSIKWFKRKKIKYIRTNVLIKNKSSIKLMKSFNFKPRHINLELKK